MLSAEDWTNSIQSFHAMASANAGYWTCFGGFHATISAEGAYWTVLTASGEYRTVLTAAG